MLVDCDSCIHRGAACAGCVASARLDAPSQVIRLDADERRAIEVLSRAGFDVRVLAEVTPHPRRRPRPARRRRSAHPVLRRGA